MLLVLLLLGLLGGSSASGSGAAQGTGAFSLSTNNINHISKHVPSVFANQVPHMSNQQLTDALQSRSFFDPQWSQAQVNNAVQRGFNTLRSQNLTGEHILTINGERITFFIHTNGNFGTAYGSYRLTPCFFGR